jgi:hypothetical protein
MAVNFAIMFNVYWVGNRAVLQYIPGFAHEMPFQKAKGRLMCRPFD